MWREQAIIVLSLVWLITFMYLIYSFCAMFIIGAWAQFIIAFLLLLFLSIVEIFVSFK